MSCSKTCRACSSCLGRVLRSVNLLFRRDASIYRGGKRINTLRVSKNGPKPTSSVQNPDKRPRIIVPRTMSLDNAIVVISDEAKPAGKGICDNAKS